jgi:hypothetical protein
MSAKLYARTPRKFVGSGQQALVVERFDLGSCTIKEVVAHLEAHPKFHTCQSAERIAAYYICVLKKSGHIVVTDAEPVVEFNPDVEAYLAGVIEETANEVE